MSAISMAQRAYSAPNATIKSARSVEFEVLARISHRMKKAIKEGNKRHLVDAIYENRKLWTAFISDLADENNELSQELRAQIISIGLFVVKHSSAVLRDRGNAAVLLEINASILGGLKIEGQGK